MAKASSPTRSTSRGGMVALVSTEVTSPHEQPGQRRPDVDGGEAQPGVAPRARRPRPRASSVRVHQPVQVLGQVRRPPARVRVLRLRPVRVDLAPVEQRALAAAAAQRVGQPGGRPSAARTSTSESERSSAEQPSPVVEHPRPDPVDHQVAQLRRRRSPRASQQRRGRARRPAARADVTRARTRPGRDLDAEAGRHHLFELVRLVEDDDVVLGQHDPPAGQVGPVEVGVDHDDVGRGRPVAGRLGEALARPRGS